jgi:type IV secretory pathway TraG/TraD family ATPase VirD4
VVLILSDTKRAKRLLSSLRQTAHAAREFFQRDPRVLAHIQSTISAHLSGLRAVAALWARSKQKISLTQWVNSECILVLGNDESLRAPMDAINRVIFQRITELVLAQSESRTRRTFCFLDECKEIGKLDCLPRLLTKGRSKGVRSVLAFQDIEGMRAVYGDHLAHEVVGMCANKAFLRTDCYETAKWACQIIGDIEQREWTRSITRGSNKSTSQSEHIQKREAILPAQVMQLSLAHDGQFEGYFVTPGIGVYHRTVSFARRLLPLGNVANFCPRPPEDQYLLDDTPPRNSLDDIGPITGSRDDNEIGRAHV